jgi:thioredoxin-related protein
MSNLTGKLKVGADIAIIIVALILGAVVVKKYLFPPPPQALPEISSGTKVSLPGVDWGQNGKTLVLVLQEGCHFCSQSAPFYQRLVQETSGQPGFHIVAVLPQKVDDAREYLSELNVPVQDVRQSQLDDLGVSGTPTLILVDNHGTVIKSWLGQLPTEKEKEVLSKVRS